MNVLINGLPLEQPPGGAAKDVEPLVVQQLVDAQKVAEGLARDNSDQRSGSVYSAIARHLEFRQHLIKVCGMSCTGALQVYAHA